MVCISSVWCADGRIGKLHRIRNEMLSRFIHVRSCLFILNLPWGASLRLAFDQFYFFCFFIIIGDLSLRRQLATASEKNSQRPRAMTTLEAHQFSAQSERNIRNSHSHSVIFILVFIFAFISLNDVDSFFFFSVSSFCITASVVQIRNWIGCERVHSNWIRWK